MPSQIRALFVNPPIAIARLGASSTPMDAFVWADSADPHLQTVIAPAWTLDVQADATVAPRMPASLRFRDGNDLRPVAPFFEIWALVGNEGTAPATWTPARVTPQLITQEGATLANLTVTIDARNAKAAYRTRLPRLVFGTYPGVRVRADQFTPVALVGFSPPNASPRMVPAGSAGIPLGSVQMIRSQAQPAAGSTPWEADVNVEVIRFRFTPPAGEFYGPPNAANRFRRGVPAVPQSNAFLSQSAGWAGALPGDMDWVNPFDTFDTVAGGTSSLGVVDDTSSATIDVELRVGARVIRARASLLVGPPDYAPDRRPFLSLADDLNDRCSVSRAAPALSATEQDVWVRDLFERAYETVSLFNVDEQRNNRGATVPASKRRPPIPNDGVPTPTRAMGGRDRLRADRPLPAPSGNIPLPLSQRAAERHRDLAEIEELKAFVQQQPQRLEQLIRPPFAVAAEEDPFETTMQMPPFMRNSNAQPLTVAAWQYAQLMQWVNGVLAPPPPPPPPVPVALAVPRRRTAAGNTRREQVLQRLRGGGQ